MADGENALLDPSARVSDTGEPLSKKPKLGVTMGCGVKTCRTEQGTGEARAAEVAERAEGERKVEAVAVVVGQATAPSGGDNELVSELDGEPLNQEEKALVDGPTTELPGVPPNGCHSHDCDGDDDDDDDDDGEDDNDDRSSRASSSDWTPQPQIGSYSFIQQHIMRETDPRTILKDLLPETVLPPDLDDMTLWQIIINISEPPKRKKRKDLNTLEDVVRLLQESKRILVLTGAGVSVSCGIPDFRSRDGIYARLAKDFPDLPDPQAMFDIEYFRRDPRPFFKFAKEIFPGQFQPSPCHKFISMLDKEGKLLRNYTQNIDTLEQVAGVRRIIQCHGSFATASCLICKYKVDCEAIREDIFNQVVPHCPRCPDFPLAIMKPDIVFFGENLPEQFHRAMKRDKDEVDLLIVIGSSLKVRPVALIPSSIPHEVPQILINREQLSHLNFDVELLGDCDVIINELCHRLGGDYKQLCFNPLRLSEITEKPPRPQRDLTADPACDATPNSPQLGERETGRSKPTSAEPVEDAEGRLPPKATPPPEDVTDSHPNTRTQSPEHEDNESLEPPLGDVHTDDAFRLKDRNPKIEGHRRCWLSRIGRSPISKRLESCQYLFQAPNHYIFHGAEVYSNSEDETSSSCGSESEGSFCSRSPLEEEEDSDADELYGATTADEEQEAREEGLRDTLPLKQASGGFPSAVQSDRAAEDVPNAAQTDSAAEDVPNAAQTDSAAEDVPNAAQTDSAAEDVPNAAQTDSVAEDVPNAAQTDSAAEDVPNAAQTVSAAEDVPNAAQTVSAAEDVPNAAQTESVAEDVPNAAQTESVAEDVPDAAQTESVAEDVPNAAQTDSVAEDVPNAAQTDSVAEDVPNAAQI
ncbi:NAD-dependent protein deacetylase sirtuin-1 [Anguilla anguilla]|uniref:NAD-dependent protein deacetylase sirtuin-1 n=1 Tax=Anguilla anguilla TaxID=7936 RepID=UPI0015AC4B8D|nr:NAD-dependent protein deacetylase sirtuin-1 [Anguilla anguilla]